MATRSRIGIEFEDGSIESIYCHWDGYVEGGVGDTLKEHYTNKETIFNLMDFGDRSVLLDEPSEKESYAARGEQDVFAITVGSLEEFLDQDYGEEYYYLFRFETGEWNVWNKYQYIHEGDGPEVLLSKAAEAMEEMQDLYEQETKDVALGTTSTLATTSAWCPEED